MRRAAKRDDNEGAIVKALRQACWRVVRVSDRGFPDLVAVRNGRIVLFEVKGPDGSLTPAQTEVHGTLASGGVTVHVVRSPAEALTVVNGTALPPAALDAALAEYGSGK